MAQFSGWELSVAGFLLFVHGKASDTNIVIIAKFVCL